VLQLIVHSRGIKPTENNNSKDKQKIQKYKVNTINTKLQKIQKSNKKPKITAAASDPSSVASGGFCSHTTNRGELISRPFYCLFKKKKNCKTVFYMSSIFKKKMKFVRNWIK
jgi:hypothetical protein